VLKLQERLRQILTFFKKTIASELPHIQATLKTKTEAIRTKTSGYFDVLLRRGGLKLKLIGFVVAVLLITVTVLSTFIIQLMKSSIETKAFEVATTSIERIADFSTHALLERSYENRVTLNEMINDIRLSKIEGLLDVSIYERQKTNTASAFKYMAGFGHYDEGTLLDDPRLIGSLNDTMPDGVTYDTREITTKAGELEAYRFVKPILYSFQDRTILLGVVILYYDKEAITGIVKRAIRFALLIAATIVLATIILVYFAGLRFTRPILAVADAATDVSEGRLDVKLDVTTNDEIGELAERFNRMVTGLREREKMQKFVSGSTMNMIQEDASRQLILGGEYRTLTFLFSDIRGFTAMSETMKPDEVVEVINFYLNLQSEIIKAHGGDIDKFVGDEIMASFSGDDAVERAIQSAVTIQTQIAEENAKREKAGETVCNVGIGINKGEVTVGNIGSHDRMDFTSIGSVVNLAARLCSSAAAGQILIEQSTRDEADNSHETRPEEPITVKGISHPVAVSSITPKGD
jgi:class 3 adenylate cyclase